MWYLWAPSYPIPPFPPDRILVSACLILVEIHTTSMLLLLLILWDTVGDLWHVRGVGAGPTRGRWVRIARGQIAALRQEALLRGRRVASLQLIAALLRVRRRVAAVLRGGRVAALLRGGRVAALLRGGWVAHLLSAEVGGASIVTGTWAKLIPQTPIDK